MDERPMNVRGALEKLGGALVLMHRSVLQYSIAAGGVTGFPFQALVPRFSEFAAAELHDARRLVEKIVALGGDPPTDVAPLRWTRDPERIVGWLIQSETETLEALRRVIPDTGSQADGEALEHLLEHVIMRKQEQVDFLMRARRATD
jgi:bacterioferritin (cytochrome b1)